MAVTSLKRDFSPIGTHSTPCELPVWIKHRRKWVPAEATAVRASGLSVATDLEIALNQLIEFAIDIDGERVVFHGRSILGGRAAQLELQLYGVSRDRARSAQWATLVRSTRRLR